MLITSISNYIASNPPKNLPEVPEDQIDAVVAEVMRMMNLTEEVMPTNKALEAVRWLEIKKAR